MSRKSIFVCRVYFQTIILSLSLSLSLCSLRRRRSRVSHETLPIRQTGTKFFDLFFQVYHNCLKCLHSGPVQPVRHHVTSDFPNREKHTADEEVNNEHVHFRTVFNFHDSNLNTRDLCTFDRLKLNRVEKSPSVRGAGAQARTQNAACDRWIA